MAYQPVEIGAPPSFGIADAMMEARRSQRQKQQDAWEQMYRAGEGDRAQQRIDLEKQRQAQLHEMEQAKLDRENQDRQASIQQTILGLHDKGLSHEADQLAQIYGLHGQQQAPGMAKPQAPQEPAPLGPEPQLSPLAALATLRALPGPLGAVGHAAFPSPQEARARARENLLVHGQGPVSPDALAMAGDTAANESAGIDQEIAQYGQATRQFAAAREAQGAYPQQVLDYRDKQAQYDEAAKHAPIAYAGKGMSFMVNPLERHQAQAAQNAERADTLLAALGASPQLAPYAKTAAAMARSGLADPKALFADVDAMAKSQAEIDRKNAGEPAHSTGRFEQEKELARIRAAAAERAAGGIKPLPEATDLGHEMSDALQAVRDKRIGIAEEERKLRSSINLVTSNPENPTNWTNFIDAMIRSNTGKAAIVQQYNLYTHNAGGTWDQIENWAKHAQTGAPGATIQRNLLGSAKQALGQWGAEGSKIERTFHDTYANDPRIKRNPEARAKFEAMYKTTFNDMEKHPAGDPIGTVKDLPGGGKVKKVGENNWEPVQ